MQIQLASRTARMNASAIREILKVVGQPGMISLAGGIPAPESFPLDDIRAITDRVYDTYGPAALQYDATEGFHPLREALVPYLAERGIETAVDHLTIFSGSQNALDTLGKLLISPGDHVVVEAPSYLGALSAFNPYEPSYLAVATDADGLIPDALEAILHEHPVKFIYLVPTFQNPTGRTLSMDRRRAVADLLQQHDVLLVEDDPYGALRYRGEALPPVKTLAPDHVVYLSSFSKIMAPGLRIGYSVAPLDLTRWMVVAKQAVDLHTQTLGQAIAAEYLAGGYLRAHLPRIIDLYRPRLETMLDALEECLPEGFTWSHPDGGMFVWVEGPCDADALYDACVARGVAFVPGRTFYPHADRANTLRLNFSMVNEETIANAVGVIGDAARAVLAER